MPPFSPSTRSLPQIEDRVSLGELKAAATALAPGQASDFRVSRDGGFILHVQSRLPVDDAKLKLELPAYLTELRQERLYVAFNEWFRRQLELAGVKLTGGDNAGE